jgi:hypothetical protein
MSNPSLDVGTRVHVTTNISLNCVLYNVRSINNKLPDLYDILYFKNYDCVFLTETWLDQDIPISLLDPRTQYSVVRQDRRGRIDGGVCAFISRKFKYIEIPVSMCNRKSNILAFDLLSNHSKICFVLLYRPPSNCLESVDDVKEFNSFITNLSYQNKPICIVGDLNCKGIDWSYSTRPSSAVESIVYNTFCYNDFCQCVPKSTRNTSLLDIVCINNPILIDTIDTTAPFNNSDHDGVIFSISLPGLTAPNITTVSTEPPERMTKKYVYNWKQADFQSLELYLSNISWSDMTPILPQMTYGKHFAMLLIMVLIFMYLKNITSTDQLPLLHGLVDSASLDI